MKLLLDGLIVGAARSALAQKEISYDSLTDIHKYKYGTQFYDYRTNGQQNSHRTVAVKGSPFLDKNWQQGGIPFKNRRSLALPINYKTLKDHVVVSLADGKKQVYPESFRINDLLFVRMKINISRLCMTEKSNCFVGIRPGSTP